MFEREGMAANGLPPQAKLTGAFDTSLLVFGELSDRVEIGHGFAKTIEALTTFGPTDEPPTANGLFRFLVKKRLDSAKVLSCRFLRRFNFDGVERIRKFEDQVDLGAAAGSKGFELPGFSVAVFQREHLLHEPVLEEKPSLVGGGNSAMELKRCVAKPYVAKKHFVALLRFSACMVAPSPSGQPICDQSIFEQHDVTTNRFLRNFCIIGELGVVQPMTTDGGKRIEESRIVPDISNQRFRLDLLPQIDVNIRFENLRAEVTVEVDPRQHSHGQGAIEIDSPEFVKFKRAQGRKLLKDQSPGEKIGASSLELACTGTGQYEAVLVLGIVDTSLKRVQ